MSVKKAQKIVNDVYNEYGISLVGHHIDDLECLRDKLEDFLHLCIETDDLIDPSMEPDGFKLDDVDDLEEEEDGDDCL